MGFGKLLEMQVDGIPSKLGYFVIDHFNPDEMEIKFGNVSIKVDVESINQLLGVPNSGIDLTSITPPPSKTFTPFAYKNRYGSKMFSFKDVVKKITQTDVNSGIMFKLDFLVLFFNSMVECHKNGLCKTTIVDLVNEETNFSDIDWCTYIISLIKRSKNDWHSKDFTCFFRGALTILTVRLSFLIHTIH